MRPGGITVSVCSWPETNWAKRSALEPKQLCTLLVDTLIGGTAMFSINRLAHGFPVSLVNPPATTRSAYFTAL